MAGIINSQRL